MPNDKLVEYLVKRVDSIETKVDKLLAFKWTLVGSASAISVVVSIGWKLIELFVGKK